MAHRLSKCEAKRALSRGMDLAHAVGMSNVRKRFLEKTDGKGFIQHVLLTAAVAIGLAGAITSEQTVLNAKIASITSSVAVRTQCRPDARIENSQPPAPRCVRQTGHDRPSDR